MKQKLALVSALVPQPEFCCSMSQLPASILYPVVSLGRTRPPDGEGLTILVATPYLDEAERCHRIALMYQGEIHQIGTPVELRASLGAKRLELRTADLRKAASELSGETGPDKRIIDVQRFGEPPRLAGP